MPTPDELRAALDEARAEFRSTLESVNENWDRKPAAGEGEAAWSARQAAQHAISAEVFFAKAVCDACGYPGPEPPSERYTTPADALAGFERAVETSQGRLKYVSQEELSKPHETFDNVENLLNVAASHLREHAAQIRAAVS